jgi:hypothetical protein
MDHAAGTVATARGPLAVAWERSGETLHLQIECPEGMKIRVKRNETHSTLKVRREVKRVGYA